MVNQTQLNTAGCPNWSATLIVVNRIAVFATMALLVAFAFILAAEDADVQSGTWKMNPAKSKYNIRTDDLAGSWSARMLFSNLRSTMFFRQLLRCWH
jgi:hypothetical protein